MKTMFLIIGFDKLICQQFFPILFKTEQEANTFCKNSSDELTVYSSREIMIGNYEK